MLTRIGSFMKKEIGNESWREWNEQEPLPLRRELPPSAPFPTAALGDLLGGVAQQLNETIQAPSGLCAQSVLAATNLAVQGHANVEIDGRVRPLSENFVTIGESGERKSAVDSEALFPIRLHQRTLRNQYELDLERYRNAKDTYDAKRSNILKETKKHSRSEMQQELEMLGPPPTPLIYPMIVMEEPTFEGLIKQLAIGHPSIGLFSDEGGLFLGGHGMKDENQLKTIAGLSKLWDGGEISRVRAGEGATMMYGKRLATHLMMQPHVAATLFNSSLLRSQGFLARYLITSPQSTIGNRPYKTQDLSKIPEVLKYRERLSSILKHPLPVDENQPNELKPRNITLTSEGRKMWINLHDDIEKQLRLGGKFHEISGFGSKAAEHALRIAGTLTLLENIDAREISFLSINCSEVLIKYYLEEALRISQGLLVSPEITQAETLLTWLNSLPDLFIHLAKIYQRGPASLREARTARSALAILEEHGWVLKQPPMDLDGNRRKDVWAIRKRLS